MKEGGGESLFYLDEQSKKKFGLGPFLGLFGHFSFFRGSVIDTCGLVNNGRGLVNYIVDKLSLT